MFTYVKITELEQDSHRTREISLRLALYIQSQSTGRPVSNEISVTL